MLTKIVSGGQTGVDRAALDVALELELSCGGWCPRGRRAEDGPIPERYPVTETPWSGYPQRTAWNVRDSDGTLILLDGEPDRGTRLTIALAARKHKPCLVVNLAERPDTAAVRAWAEANRVEVVNVAGPRGSASPTIYARAAQFLRSLLGSSSCCRFTGRIDEVE
jgi:hypothetical protein